MIKEIKKLRTYEQKLKSKLAIFQYQLSLLEKDSETKKMDLRRLKSLCKMISETQDVCDKINTLLYNMIKSHEGTYVK